MKFRQLSTEKILSQIENAKSVFWMKKRKESMLSLFKEASIRVPAYKDFLKKNQIKAEKITSLSDFLKVPPINKSNYLRRYKLKDLCWDGSLLKPGIFTATSGSTGESVYFLRNRNLDFQYSIILESFLKELDCKEATLVIVCFGMGLWIGGIITYQAYEIVSNRSNYPISIITPGINKKEIYSVLKNIAQDFNQTIIVGYPPFVKDIVDGSDEEGIDLKKLNIKFHFAAEAISEELRDYLTKKTEIKNIYRDFISIYGSADIGAMAYESLVSILIRRKAKENKKLFNSIFTPINKTPTLAQYNPYFINFEEVNGELLLTGNSAMPLVRYAIGDHGGIFSYDEVEKKFKQNGLNLKTELDKANIPTNRYRLPFVFVYERKDLSTTFFGLWVYPEWIKPVLYSDPLSKFLTGRFTILTKYDKSNNQFMEINFELRRNIKESEEIRKLTIKNVVQSLSTNSSEYREMLIHLKSRAYPKIVFWNYEDPKYFAPGIKQKWVSKNL